MVSARERFRSLLVRPTCTIAANIFAPYYRAAEREYYQQHGYVPAQHLIKLRREVVERVPWIVQSLLTAFTASKRLWLARRRHLADTTP
jgi:hypothetical protein